MNTTKVSYHDLLQHQNLLRVANRRLLEEICPKDIHDNLSALLTNNETNINLEPSNEDHSSSAVKKNKEKNIENRKNVDEEDDGYKSGPLDVSEDVIMKKEKENHLSLSQTDLSICETSSTTKTSAQRRRPASASRVQNITKSPSMFHQRCKPIEPNRHFIAIPFPSNLYQSDSIKVSSSESLSSEKCRGDEKGVSGGIRGRSSQPRGILKKTATTKSDTKVAKQTRRTIRSNTSVNYKSRLLEKSLTVNKTNQKERNNLEYEDVRGRKTAVNSTNLDIPPNKDIQCPNCYNEFPSRPQLTGYRNTRMENGTNSNNWKQQNNSLSSAAFGSISTLPQNRKDGTNEPRNAIQIKSRPQTPPANMPRKARLNVTHHGNGLKRSSSSKKLTKATFPQRQGASSDNLNFCDENNINNSNLHFHPTDVKKQVALSQNRRVQTNYHQEPMYDSAEKQCYASLQLSLCKRCHCQSCFHQYLDKRDGEKPKRKEINEKKAYGNKNIGESPYRSWDSDRSQWSQNWFKDIASFRKDYFWDCHADRTKL